MVPEKTNTLPILLFFCIVSVGLHLPSFGLEHEAGDEIVYRVLSAEMGWDLSHYTTMDHPRLSKNNFPLYRAPLFAHPPLLPLILKGAREVGDPTLLGLAFLAGSMCLLLVFIRRTLLSFAMSPNAIVWALALASFCPVLMLTTTKLLADGLLAIYLFCGISLAIESFRDDSAGSAGLAACVRKMLVAGLLLAVGPSGVLTLHD